MSKLGIVIIGYKNKTGITRLLDSLGKVDFEGDTDIKLIFSIDYSGNNDIEKIALNYEWNYGEKVIVTHNVNMGLKNHILSCGDYMKKYNLDAIAVLEDDIYVSPQMYSYMKNAVMFYKDDTRIAGISLYKHELNINKQSPFMDYYDGGDTFFIQYAMSWGQVWMREQWDSFRRWYDNEQWKRMDTKFIPQNILKWKNSWLKFHIMYCIDENKYFVYPRVALSTNFTDVGEHNKDVITSMQVKLCMKKNSRWQFSLLDDTMAVYDAFFESEYLKKNFGLRNLEIDIYGAKVYHSDTEYIISKKILPYKIEKTWGLFLRPIEANVYMNILGKDIFLYNLSVSKKIQKQNIIDKVRMFEYDLKGINLICLENVIYCSRRILFLIKCKVYRKMKELKLYE